MVALSRCGRRLSLTRSLRSSGARRSGLWCRSRTRSRARCGRTLDTLAFDAERGDDRRRARLPGPGPPDRPRGGRARASVEAVLSHPQPLAQCARFLRDSFAGVELRSVSSTAAAVRMVSESARPWAALGARAAASLYGCELLLEGVEDSDDNVTRFVWIAPAGTEPGGRRGRGRPRWSSPSSAPTTPGALVDALGEFSSRGINLTRIESRPLRQGLGRYMFFCDLEGEGGRSAGRRGDRGSCGRRPSRSGSSAPIRSIEAQSAERLQFPATMARVLVLNATYEPINVCTLRRAAVLLLKEKAELLEQREGAALHSEHMTMERPDVIRLVNYVRIPREAHRRKITRRAVLARDSWTCQYCGSTKVRPHRRPRHPPLPRRPLGLGEHRRRLRPLQPPQGQPPPARDPHAPGEDPEGTRRPPSSSRSPARRSRRPGSSTCRRRPNPS